MKASNQDLDKPVAIKLVKGSVAIFSLYSSKSKTDPIKTILGYKAIEKIQVQEGDEVHSFAFNKLYEGYNTQQKPALLFSEPLATNELLLVISGIFANKVSYTKLTKADSLWQQSVEALAKHSFPAEKEPIEEKAHGNFHIYILSAAGEKAENFKEYYDYFYKMVDKYNTNTMCKTYIREPLEHPSHLGLINLNYSTQKYDIFSSIDSKVFELCQVVSLEDLFSQADNLV